MPIRVQLDAGPLLGERTGIGTYVAHLADELPAFPDVSLRLAAFSLRGRRTPSHRIHRVRFPARALQRAWARSDVPPVEWLTGATDVFHATNFVLPPLRRARGIVTVHDLAYRKFPETVTPAVLAYRELVPRSLRRAALVLCPSAATAADLTEAYALPDGKVRVTPLGVEPAWFEPPGPPPTDLGLPPSYVVFVGTSEPRKNVTTVLEALSTAPAVEFSALVIVGPDGWGEQPTSGAFPVHRTGYLPAADVRRVVGHARALVLPSRYEGFGLPVLEALAAGTPVVASDIAAHREITAGAGSGVRLVPPDDVEAWAAALAHLPAADPVGRDWARRWTWENCAAATVQAYRDVLA